MKKILPTITSKIALPIILVGLFSMVIFIALEYQQLNVSFYIIFLLFGFYIFFFGLAMGQNISSPIKELLGKAKELSKGNLSSRAYLETKDELSELADVFNNIAEILEQTHERECNAEKSVDIKVRARAQELEETIRALEQKINNRTVELEKAMKETASLEKELKEKNAEILKIKGTPDVSKKVEDNSVPVKKK